MQPSPRSAIVLLVLSAVGVLTHLVPHDLGVSTVGAVSMLGAAYLPRRWLVVPVLLTLLIADAVSGFYGALAMSFVYVAHVLAALVLALLRTPVGPGWVLGAAVAHAVVFYAISNITPMALAYYPNSVAGWLACYVNGLPFLLKGIAANLVFGGLAFSAVAVWRWVRANRLAFG